MNLQALCNPPKEIAPRQCPNCLGFDTSLKTFVSGHLDPAIYTKRRKCNRCYGVWWDV